MYEYATEEQQRYKEGKVILERALIAEINGIEEIWQPSRDNHPPQTGWLKDITTIQTIKTATLRNRLPSIRRQDLKKTIYNCWLAKQPKIKFARCSPGLHPTGHVSYWSTNPAHSSIKLLLTTNTSVYYLLHHYFSDEVRVDIWICGRRHTEI